MRQRQENGQLEPETLRRARWLTAEREGVSPLSLSQRELARRTAVELGQPARAGALQVALSRAWRGHNVWLDPQTLDALASVVGLRSGVDLTEPYRWAYREFNPNGRRLRWIGGRLPVFSAGHLAYEAKGWVTFQDGTLPPEVQGVGPSEVFHSELVTELESGGDESLMLLDPDAAGFRARVGMVLAA